MNIRDQINLFKYMLEEMDKRKLDKLADNEREIIRQCHFYLRNIEHACVTDPKLAVREVRVLKQYIEQTVADIKHLDAKETLDLIATLSVPQVSDVIDMQKKKDNPGSKSRSSAFKEKLLAEIDNSAGIKLLDKIEALQSIFAGNKKQTTLDRKITSVLEAVKNAYTPTPDFDPRSEGDLLFMALALNRPEVSQKKPAMQAPVPPPRPKAKEPAPMSAIETKVLHAGLLIATLENNINAKEKEVLIACQDIFRKIDPLYYTFNTAETDKLNAILWEKIMKNSAAIHHPAVLEYVEKNVFNMDVNYHLNVLNKLMLTAGKYKAVDGADKVIAKLNNLKYEQGLSFIQFYNSLLAIATEAQLYGLKEVGDKIEKLLDSPKMKKLEEKSSYAQQQMATNSQKREREPIVRPAPPPRKDLETSPKSETTSPGASPRSKIQRQDSRLFSRHRVNKEEVPAKSQTVTLGSNRKK